MIAAEVAQFHSPDSTLIDGAPTRTVEILSPRDKIEDIKERIDDSQDASVPLV